MHPYPPEGGELWAGVLPPADTKKPSFLASRSGGFVV